MNLFRIQIVFALFFIGMGNAVYAADLNGIWKSDIETMIIYQDRNALKVVCSINYSSRPAILYGEGTVLDGQCPDPHFPKYTPLGVGREGNVNTYRLCRWKFLERQVGN
jgi:hypothetical protein